MASSRTNSSWKLFAFLDISHQNAAFEGLKEADAPISGFWVHKTQMFMLHSALQDAWDHVDYITVPWLPSAAQQGFWKRLCGLQGVNGEKHEI